MLKLKYDPSEWNDNRLNIRLWWGGSCSSIAFEISTGKFDNLDKFSSPGSTEISIDHEVYTVQYSSTVTSFLYWVSLVYLNYCLHEDSTNWHSDPWKYRPWPVQNRPQKNGFARKGLIDLSQVGLGSVGRLG